MNWWPVLVAPQNRFSFSMSPNQFHTYFQRQQWLTTEIPIILLITERPQTFSWCSRTVQEWECGFRYLHLHRFSYRWPYMTNVIRIYTVVFYITACSHWPSIFLQIPIYSFRYRKGKGIVSINFFLTWNQKQYATSLYVTYNPFEYRNRKENRTVSGNRP